MENPNRKGQFQPNMYRGKLILIDDKKRCPRCKQWKDLTEYTKDNYRKMGVVTKCKACARELHREYRIKYPETNRYSNYKVTAKGRGIVFDLTKEEFLSFWQKPCTYCGGEILTIGLDRVNNNKGYSLDNVVPCCIICNVMKLNFSRDIFIEHCEKIVNTAYKKGIK